MKTLTIIIDGAAQDVVDDIIKRIGSLAILDVKRMHGTGLYVIKLDPQLIKIAADSDGLHILRFELGETRHCVIDCFRFGKVVIA